MELSVFYQSIGPSLYRSSTECSLKFSDCTLTKWSVILVCQFLPQLVIIKVGQTVTLRAHEQDVMRVVIFHDKRKVPSVIVWDNILPHVTLIASTHNTNIVLEIKVIRIFWARPPWGFKVQLDCVRIKARQFACNSKNINYLNLVSHDLQTW